MYKGFYGRFRNSTRIGTRVLGFGGDKGISQQGGSFIEFVRGRTAPVLKGNLRSGEERIRGDSITEDNEQLDRFGRVEQARIQVLLWKAQVQSRTQLVVL